MIHDRFGGILSSAQPLIDVQQVETAALRAASPYLLNALGSPLLPGCTDATQQPWAPGFRQSFPNTAVDLIAALGATGVILPANVLAIYLADTASPLVDSLGLGPNLVAAGGPLTGRECVGLPTTSFNAKVGCEFQPVTMQQFQAPVGSEAFVDVTGGNVVSGLFVWRIGSNANTGASWYFIAKVDAGWIGWHLSDNGTNTRLRVDGAPGLNVSVALQHNDSTWHCGAFFIDDTAKSGQVFTDMGDSALGAYVGAASSATRVSLGAGVGVQTNALQLAYVAFFDVTITSAQRATFWRAFNPAALGTPNMYARTNPLVVPITASRVACYAGGNVGQMAVGYSAGFLADGNALQTGLVCEDGATFEPIGSDNLFGNANVGGGGCTFTSVDGPSGMRDGLRVTMGAAWGAASNVYVPGAVVIAGASNIPWRLDLNYRRATVGTTARAALQYWGDAGGAEFFTIVSDAASPVDWTRGGGTCTPVRAGQVNFVVAMGAAVNLDDCDFGEPAVIKNRTFANLAWRRVGTAAAAVTSTPALSMTNVGNTRYNPVRGMIELEISGFQLTNGATFLQYGAAASAGSVTLDYNAGQLRLRIYDATPALAVTVLCGALDATRWRLRISYDSRYPIPGVGGAYVAVERINVGASPTLLGTWAGPAWVPPTANCTPLYVGTDAAAGNAARCYISLA